MAKSKAKPFNVVAVIQSGRLEYEAALFALSFRKTNPDFEGRLIFTHPVKGAKWDKDPAPQNADVLALLAELNVELIPFESKVFGKNYPYGNKIEMLSALPKGEPFVFFDTDTLITGDLSSVPFDFKRPTASLRREGTWPELELYGPTYSQIWKSLYDKFGLDFDSSLDLSQPDEYWQRYLYFNAGFFFYKCPHEFGKKFLSFSTQILTEPPRELVCQSLDPWLDQVALPLVIHSLGGGRNTIPEGLLDGTISCHYRMLPMLYARESDAVVQLLHEITEPNRVKKVLKEYDPIKRMVYQGRGEKVRAMFDRDNLPRREQMIRNQIKKAGFWMR